MDEPALSPKITKLLDSLVEHLKALYADGLISAILYGSAASGEFRKGHSNVNLAVILTDISLKNLAKAKKDFSSRRYAIFNIIFFTEEYIRRTQDVFPIEFLDMRDNHRVLYGKDVFANINIDMKHLRFQCEQELKEKLMQVSRFYLATRDKTILSAFLFKSFNSTLHVLRNVIRLKGRIPPHRKEDIVSELASDLGLGLTSMSEILAAFRNNIRPSRLDINKLFLGFTDELKGLTDAVDRL